MTREEYEQRKHYEKWRAYQNSIQPILKAMTDVMALSMPAMTIYPDGKMTVVYSAETNALIAAYSSLLVEIAQSFDFDVCPLPANIFDNTANIRQ